MRLKNIKHLCYVESINKLVIFYTIFIALSTGLFLYLTLLKTNMFFYAFLLLFLSIFIITKLFYNLEKKNLYRIGLTKYLNKAISFMLLLILCNVFNSKILMFFLLVYLILFIYITVFYNNPIVPFKDISDKIKRPLISKVTTNKIGNLGFVAYICNILLYIFSFILFINYAICQQLHCEGLLIFLLSIIESFMILADIFNMRYKDDLIDFKYVELDFEDIRSSKIYYEYKTFEKSRIKRIVKIEFKGLFSNYRMKVNNQCYTKTQLFNENSVSNYIYFCIDDQTRESKKLRFIIEKDDEEDNKTYILTVYFQIEKKDNNLIISNYKIVSLRRVYNLFFKDGIEEKVTPQKILSTLKYCYKYNYQYDIAEELKLKTTHDSSWLFHNGSYGSGKSSLDLLSTLESGYTPVIISPWENNYDVDFLYLVYQKTKLCCIGRGLITNILTSIKRPTNIIFYTTIFSISTLIYELFGEFIVHLLTLGYNAIKHDKMIIDIKELMGEIIGSLDSITLKDSLTFFSFIIILLSVWFIVRIFLAEIIIHFKDSTKIHQFYYIDRILNTIRDYNLFLIIEDVDRIPKEGIEDVLRVISCLNREYTNCSRALGIISLDKENLIGEENSTFKEKEFEDLRNKVFSKEIFSGYDVRASMTKYLKEYCKVAYDLFDMESETDININRKKILGLFKNEPIHNFRINGNFRNIHEVINMLIYDDYWTMENMKSKIEEFIEIPIATWNSYNS